MEIGKINDWNYTLEHGGVFYHKGTIRDECTAKKALEDIYLCAVRYKWPCLVCSFDMRKQDLLRRLTFYGAGMSYEQYLKNRLTHRDLEILMEQAASMIGSSLYVYHTDIPDIEDIKAKIIEEKTIHQIKAVFVDNLWNIVGNYKDNLNEVDNALWEISKQTETAIYLNCSAGPIHEILSKKGEKNEK